MGLCVRAYSQLAGSPPSPALCIQHPWSWYLEPGIAGLRQSPPWDWKLVGSGILARLQLHAGKPRKHQLNKRFSLEYLV